MSEIEGCGGSRIRGSAVAELLLHITVFILVFLFGSENVDQSCYVPLAIVDGCPRLLFHGWKYSFCSADHESQYRSSVKRFAYLAWTWIAHIIHMVHHHVGIPMAPERVDV